MRSLTHPSDHLLLLAHERELTPRRLARMDRHLAGCPVCRARQSQLLSALNTFAQREWPEVSRPAHDTADVPVRPATPGMPGMPGIDDARRRLQRAMQQARAVQGSTSHTMPATRGLPVGHVVQRLRAQMNIVMLPRLLQLMPRLAVAAAVVVMLLVGRVAWVGVTSAHPDPAAVPMRPVASLTPGAVADLSAAALCAGERPSRALTPAVREQVLRAYGMRGVAGDTYELDALITPELGGTAARENVWPQRYGSSWNAHVKDALENLLAARVCRGELPLATAQRALADDWIASYKRYFATDAPLPAHLIATQVDEDLIVRASDSLIE